MAFDENGRIAEAKSHVESLELEIAEFKRDSKNTLKVLKKEVDDLSKNFGTKRDGPPRVQGLQSGLVHENNTPITSVPPLYWRTKCGWSFKYGNFCFVPAEKPVTRSKCLGGLQTCANRKEVIWAACEGNASLIPFDLWKCGRWMQPSEWGWCFEPLIAGTRRKQFWAVSYSGWWVANSALSWKINNGVKQRVWSAGQLRNVWMVVVCYQWFVNAILASRLGAST